MMARPFKDRQRETVHQWLVEWASFVSKITDRSPLGARIGAYSARGGTTRPPGAICPEVMRPARLVRVEDAYSLQSITVRRNIKCYYRMIPLDSPNYIKVTPKAREHFLKRMVSTLFP